MLSRSSRIFSGFRSAVILASLAGAVSGVAVLCQMLGSDQGDLAQHCTNAGEFNASLPSSHPSNRCAMQDELTWFGWFSGKSRSGQFHFIDLLELLHGHEGKPLQELPAKSDHSRNL